MQLLKVYVEDIYPDDKNPRKDFGDIKALAASFELNQLNPGEPVNPPVTVKDGGIYRIVDGERRYKAIKHNKLSKCNVIVCEDMDEANTMVAMLATDDKQQLSDIEKSRGVQQMLLLGVDPITVEKTARMKPGSAAQAKKACELIDDAAEDMTLDRLYAIAELSDDPEAVEELTNCRESEWSWKAQGFLRAKKEREKWVKLESALSHAGIPIVEEIGEAYKKYVTYVTSEEDFISEVQEEEIFGNPEARFQAKKQNYSATIYTDTYIEKEEHIDPEEEAQKQRIDAFMAAVEDGSKKRLEFFASKVDDLESMPCIMEKIEEDLLDDMGDFFTELSESLGYETSLNINDTLAFWGYADSKIELIEWRIRDIVKGNHLDKWDISVIKKYTEWVNLFEEDGFEVSDEEQSLLNLCEDALDAAEEADDDSQDQ